LNEQHRIELVAGVGLQKLTMEWSEGLKSGINFPYVQSTQPSHILSFFSRIHYAFRDRYLLTLTARQDGYQSFANKQSYFKPAVSLGWRVSEEGFMENAGAIEELKLRVGYGNNRASLSDQWNLGLDLGLWHNRFLLTTDYYRGTRQDQTQIPLPKASGMSLFILPISTASRGVEFSVRTRNTTGKFQWDTQLTLAHNLTTIRISGLGTGSGDGIVGEPITEDFILRRWGQDSNTSSNPNNTTRPSPETKLADTNPK
jgi:hypothetical protein